MELHEQLELVASREDLANFVGVLASDLQTNSDDWENPSLEHFLDAMEAWIRDSDRQRHAEQPSWRAMAEILYAARIYE